MPTRITADLPTLNFPREVDYPTQEDWADFSAAAEENFGILGGDWSTQMQLWKTQANAMSTEFNTNATIAQGLADYQGDWISQGYTLGQTVSVGEVYYICKLTHATGQNPTDVSSLYWNLALGNWSLKADKTEVDLKIDKDISLYSSKPTPIDSDLIPLSDSVSSFGIKKLSWANLKATLKTYFDTLYNFYNPTPTIMTGIVSFNSVTNEVSGTNIGVGVEIGDVILFSGATDTKNNNAFTIGVINNENSIIVNPYHANKGTSRNVATRVNDANVVVKLLAKWYNASDGLGQDWVNVIAGRLLNTVYPNITNREIKLLINGTTTAQGGGATITINGNLPVRINNYYGAGGASGTGEISISRNGTYSLAVGSFTVNTWYERV